MLGGFKKRYQWQDDIETKSCGYVKGSVDIRQGNKTYSDLVVFKDVMYLKDDLAEEYVELMEIPEAEIPDMTFMDAYHYADLVFSQRFEGINNTIEWTDDDVKMIGLTQKYGLSRPIDT